MSGQERRKIHFNPGHADELATLLSQTVEELTPESLAEAIFTAEQIDRLLYVLREEVATIATLVLNIELLVWDIEDAVLELNETSAARAEDLLRQYESHIERGETDTRLIVECVELLLEKIHAHENPLSLKAQEHIQVMTENAQRIEIALRKIDAYSQRYSVARAAVEVFRSQQK